MWRTRARWATTWAVALVAGCATTTPPPAPTTAPPPAELAAYLPDPTVGYPDADPGLVATRDAHARLLRTGDARAAQQSLANLLAERPDLGPARVALAQALLVAGESGRAVDAARAAAPDGVARELVLGRALEASGDPAAAAIVFAKAQERSPVARSATDRLRTRASNLLAERAQEATARGRYAEAEGIVADLALLQPTARRTLELRLGLAGASGDRRLELDLLRDLTAEPGASREQRLRRADLELEIGDAAAGLAIVQTLASASPGDPDLAEHLRRAQFRWRIVNSPESVRVAASQAQLTRAEGAVLLYWCLPRVRTGAAGEARIASDILDHPAREEIVRVVNLGLLTVDDTLHTFGPDRPLRRSELLGALMRVLDRSAPGARCGGGATNACERAAACGLVPSAGDCLASGYLSGAEALEMIRRATERLEGP